MNARKKQKIFEEQLIVHRDYAQARIEAGDPDFDDWVYRLRDAANEMLEIMMVVED